MTNTSEMFEIAVTRHQAGLVGEAEAIYRDILSVDPCHAFALNNLGLIVSKDEALELFTRAVSIKPDCVMALVNLGRTLEAQEKPGDAIAWYEQAVALEPDCAIALANLGTIHYKAKRFSLAEHYYRQALSLNPQDTTLNWFMVSLLESKGRLAEAQIYRDQAPRLLSLSIETAPKPRRTVLVLRTLGDGNMPLDMLLPKETTTRISWLVDCADDEHELSLPPYDIAFNAVSCADIAQPTLDRVSQFHSRRPVLNPPAAVRKTRRDLLPQLLSDIPDVLVPNVVLLPRSEVLKTAELEEKLETSGIRCPVIVRPIGAHGGDGMVLAKTPQQLAGVQFSEEDAFYFTNYHDYRSSDGYYRKFRAFFIDRKMYPYHLAISKNWLVHYFSADMMSDDWKREEEHRFLANPAAALGPKAITALEAIGRRLDLDFAGIDFTLLPDGRVLVFEANATMLLDLSHPIEDFPYKHVYVPIIAQAFEAMLERHEKSGKS